MNLFKSGFPSLLSLDFSLPRIRPSYRTAALQATAFTGFASLCAQVVWQKYLAVLVGSETRSISLVTGVFLTGLALGYWLFGRLTEKKPWSRWALLKLYGYVELATALYIACFYVYFEFLKFLSWNSPAWLAMDVLLSLLALLLPTVLMGASIPVLTACLPESEKEINPLHLKIYGWNAFGAFVGALFAGFWLLPMFGLQLSLIAGAVINLTAALVFMGNSLKGPVQRQKSAPALPSSIPNEFYIFSAFVVGALVISFEIFFVRLLNLSLGAGVYNFPMILALFVGGLAWGSLSVKKSEIQGRFFIKQILITALLLLLCFRSAPFWGIWLSHIRVSLLSIPSNYFIFKGAVFLFLFLWIVPAVFFMGRLLPLSYALLRKTAGGYGALCGRLYFFNTLGTAFGAIAIGYLAFYLFDLDELFRINILALLALGLMAAFYEKQGLSALFSLFLIILAGALPAWNRTGHYLGWFRVRQPAPAHFQHLFALPKQYGDGELLFFKDGPNVSVSVLGYKNKDSNPKLKELLPPSDYTSLSFVVNGKSIGSSLGDFSTMFLLPTLGFLYAPERETGLSSAVVGFGTGVTAGVLGRLSDSRDVTVLEIASEVLDSVRQASDFSFGPLSNPKVKIHAQDGFKYFTKTDRRFDMIVSEPSNPWIVGVENVFSLEFYELARKSLADDGVLVQWAQLYSVDAGSLQIIFRTLKKVFPYAKLYQVGWRDIAIVASPRPLKPAIPEKRFLNPFLAPFHKALGFHKPEDLRLIQVFSQDLFSRLVDEGAESGLHTLSAPRLAYRGDKTFFSGLAVDPENLTSPWRFEASPALQRKLKAFESYSSLSEDEIHDRCVPEIAFLCHLMAQAVRHKNIFDRKENSLATRFGSYIYLRKRALAPYDGPFLDSLKAEWIEGKTFSLPNLTLYLNQLLGMGLMDRAKQDLKLFHSAGLPEESLSLLEEHIETVEKESF